MSNERIRAERGEDWPDNDDDYPVLLKGEALTWGVHSVYFSAAERADAFIDQINGAPAAPSEGDGRPDRGDEVQIAGSIGNIVRVNDREGTCEIAWWMPSGGPGFGESSSVEVPLAGLHVRQQATTSRSTPAPSPSQPEPGTLDEPMISVAEANRVLADERAMHAAFRPEVVAEVAVQLSEEADWEEIARWCGGTLRYSGDPSGEVTTYLDLPGSGSVCQGMWITLDHAGRFRARAEIAPPAPPAVPDGAHERFAASLNRIGADQSVKDAHAATDSPSGDGASR